jgi:outer membrane lipoprotein-sorting protein
MPALGEVLERLHTAWDHLSSAQGTMRLWCDLQRTHDAFEIWRLGFHPASVEVLNAPVADRDTSPKVESSDDSRSGIYEQVFRFWMAKPWHWRVESLAVAPGQLSEPREILVINGTIWWTWTAGNDVHTNARAPHPEQREHSGVDRALLVMLDPAPLVGTLQLHVDGSAEALGLQGDLVDGIARNSQIDPGLWPGADQYRLLVDRQHGILLRAEALQDGNTYAATTFTDLAIDQAIPEERFVFEVPSRVRVHYHW